MILFNENESQIHAEEFSKTHAQKRKRRESKNIKVKKREKKNKISC